VSTVELECAPEVWAPAAARAGLEGCALTAAERELVDLLVSELMTNSVRHAGLGPRELIRMRVLVTQRTVRIEVVDAGPGVGVAMRAASDAGGWGLKLVDALADRWGVTRDAGTHVWFELYRAPPAVRDPAGSSTLFLGT
jgi:anti-sigma regulatory factor (Ser/Thr protein kinase)